MQTSRMKLRTKIYRLNLSFDHFALTQPGMMLEAVVIAYNEKHARILTAMHAGIEGREPWHHRKMTDCTEIGMPNTIHHYPQVLARYVQTPYAWTIATDEPISDEPISDEPVLEPAEVL